MKIFDAAQLREADTITIERQQITSAGLMERAGNEAFLWLKRKFPDKETVFHVFCGKGNNGGDGLVVARLLHNNGYRVFLTSAGEGNPSADFSVMLKKLADAGIELPRTEEISSYGTGKTVVVDALFGIGLSRESEGEYKETIDFINSSKAFVVSIDVPSGMFLDRKTDFAVQSDVVLTFQSSKLAFYLHGNYEFIKEIIILDIGLDGEFIQNAPSNHYLVEKADAFRRYRPVSSYAHKGTQGHALVIGGSYGKTGALCLAAKAALKSGCGLVTGYLPKCGYGIIQTFLPEAMAITNGEEHIEEISFGIHANAIGVGPGMGQEPETQQALYRFLKNNTVPLVVDADALNILSYNKEWLRLLPENTIITPHPKELERLIGPWADDFEKIEKLTAFSKAYRLIVVAKDACTLIISGDSVYINSTGNAALATGGSGDVLTGIITGLLAQSYNPADAAVFGVYLHGLAADVAVPETGVQAFTASSLLDYLGKAYLEIESEF